MAVPERWRLCFNKTHVCFSECSCVGMSLFVTAVLKYLCVLPLYLLWSPNVRLVLCRARFSFPINLLTFEDGNKMVADRADHLFRRGGGWNVGWMGEGRHTGVSPVLWSFRTDDTSVSAWMNLRSNAFCSLLRPFLMQGPLNACARGQRRDHVRLFSVWNPCVSPLLRLV